MKLYARMIPMAARAATARRLQLHERMTTRFRVLPHDLDINLHLNNGRYHQFIDVARLEWMCRVGVVAVMLRRRFMPVLGGTVIRFRRQLRLLDVATVETGLAGWDDRWFYVEHKVFNADREPVAFALARAMFLKQRQHIPTSEMLRSVGHEGASPKLPAHVLRWIETDAAIGFSMSAAPTKSLPADATPMPMAFCRDLASKGSIFQAPLPGAITAVPVEAAAYAPDPTASIAPGNWYEAAFALNEQEAPSPRAATVCSNSA